MNTASPEPILNGDYVLMCAQKTAESGDIVAAEIVGVDDRATLKRYKVESGKIVLLPESDDPAFQDPTSIRCEFRKPDDNFYIRGVALAVFITKRGLTITGHGCLLNDKCTTSAPGFTCLKQKPTLEWVGFCLRLLVVDSNHEPSG